MLVGERKISPSEIVGNSSGQAARLPHAALDGLGDLAQVAVARIELAPRLGEADDGAREILAGQAHPAGEGAPDEQAELGIAVVREAAADAGRGAGSGIAWAPWRASVGRRSLRSGRRASRLSALVRTRRPLVATVSRCGDDTADRGKIAGGGGPRAASPADRRGAPAPAAHPGPAALAHHQHHPPREQPAREPVAGAGGRPPVELDVVAHAPHRALLQAPAARATGSRSSPRRRRSSTRSRCCGGSCRPRASARTGRSAASRRTRAARRTRTGSTSRRDRWAWARWRPAFAALMDRYLARPLRRGRRRGAGPAARDRARRGTSRSWATPSWTRGASGRPGPRRRWPTSPATWSSST